MPLRKVNFEGLDAPLDRWLRRIYDLDIYSYPADIRRHYRNIVERKPTPTNEREWQLDSDGMMYVPEAHDPVNNQKRIEEETRLETNFSY